MGGFTELTLLSSSRSEPCRANSSAISLPCMLQCPGPQHSLSVYNLTNPSRSFLQLFTKLECNVLHCKALRAPVFRISRLLHRMKLNNDSPLAFMPELSQTVWWAFGVSHLNRSADQVVRWLVAVVVSHIRGSYQYSTYTGPMWLLRCLHH
ncbi:hypothetical protein FF38_04519 [Lucilia cuprina]|uniref:Uncharacterized protein n=1 Tax=Lucilia cuprina TaxID=7375 RepID=A0A0L0CGU7_LUCCU|nr:hypothetical protein FF38_04519 [Lucilia cuprina]